MFGNSVTLTRDTVSHFVVSRIGDAGDSGSRYYLRTSTYEVTLSIRHSSYLDKSNTNRKGVSVDRHNVEVIQRVFGSPSVPDKIRKAYMVIENDRGDDLSETQNVAGTVQEFATDANVLKLLAWES